MQGTVIISIETGCMKGTLFDSSGRELMTLSRRLKLFEDEDCIGHDPEEWYTTLAEITKQLQESFDDVYIDAISVTYTPGIFVFIDRSGSNIMNAYIKCGSRMRYQEDMYAKNFRHQDEDYRIPWKHMFHPKLSWINYNRPDIFKRIFKVLTPDGYLAYRLCGETAVDPASALFLGYNPRTYSYNLRLPDDVKLDEKLFPDIKKPGECIGIIGGETREKLGLKTDVRFVISSNYIECLSSLCSESVKFIYDAASSAICFSGGFFKIKRGSEIIRVPGKAAGEYTYGLIGNDKAMFLETVQGFMNDENMDIKYEVPGCQGVMVYPYLTGRASRGASDILCTIMGLNGGSSLGDIACSCFECMGYELKENMEEMLEYGVKFDSVVVINGGASQAFYQILSDITCLKICNIDLKSPVAAAVLSVISGVKRDTGAVCLANPDMEREAKYTQLYNLYRYTLSSIGDIYKYRKRVLKRIL